MPPSIAISPVGQNEPNPPPVQLITDRPLLFTPLTTKGITARNRVVVSPMSQYASIDGEPTDWHLVHLGHFAMGGAGIVFCEETSVAVLARKTYSCPGIYTPAQVKAYRRITDFIKRMGAVPALQLGHAGRKVATKPPWESFAPLTGADAKDGKPPYRGLSASPVPTSETALVPKEMTADDIKDVIQLHVDAVKRTVDSGYDLLEIHCAHGYIVQQFLSPTVNHRTDAYSGDLQGRMRFGFELVEAIRAAWPEDRPFFARLSCQDGQGGHWDLADTLQFAQGLKERGVDLIDCSSGGINGPLTLSVVPRLPGYHVPFAEAVRREVGILTMGPGLITEAHQAEAILQGGQSDLICMARELMWNPNWPVHAAQTLGVPDYFDLLPPGYAWWLKRREATQQLNPDG
ncbi:NADH:flavin oxidoreductase/NADH oxidase [Candidatus Entotheonella palauensis]|uniref:NADH:flavin oxidoreductase/NADH oxidase n=1 Tax=Candidatus Entotheonella palauensis TaxID=93172 RepID=UPI0021174FC2|nr:NADH:flavin oxidoreductase/NADH oxidase [Candidatus Entotheonella palauensis]